MDGNYGAGVETQREKPRVVLPLVLFFITVLTTTAAGAFYAGVNPFKDPSGFKKGLPFSLSLLFILGTHELGHFFASKRHRVATTLPHFIPVPPIPPLIGAFGAFRAPYSLFFGCLRACPSWNIQMAGLACVGGAYNHHRHVASSR